MAIGDRCNPRLLLAVTRIGAKMATNLNRAWLALIRTGEAMGFREEALTLPEAASSLATLGVWLWMCRFA